MEIIAETLGPTKYHLQLPDAINLEVSISVDIDLMARPVFVLYTIYISIVKNIAETTTEAIRVDCMRISPNWNILLKNVGR
jgi:hypothetical protein